MITLGQQENLFLVISKLLKKPVTAYAIGGTAMMFHGLKETTKDIDLVFKTEKERGYFIDALKKIGYEVIDSFDVYGKKENHPIMIKLGDERFDLFVVKVINFNFSQGMCSRAENIHKFNNNLIIKVADRHDIILMKCATDRIKDREDVITILSNESINWDIIIEEAKHQVVLGMEVAVFELGCFLEELRNIVKDKIPKKVLDKLFSFTIKQAERKKKRQR